VSVPHEAVRQLQQERDHLLLLHEALADVERAPSMDARLHVFVEAIRRIGFGRVTITLRDEELNATAIVTNVPPAAITHPVRGSEPRCCT